LISVKNKEQLNNVDTLCATRVQGLF